MQEFSLQEPQQPTKEMKKVIRPVTIRSICLVFLDVTNIILIRAGLKVRSCLDTFFGQHACVPPNFTHISFIRPGLQNYIFVSNFVELRYMM